MSADNQLRTINDFINHYADIVNALRIQHSRSLNCDLEYLAGFPAPESYSVISPSSSINESAAALKEVIEIYENSIDILRAVYVELAGRAER